MPAKTVTIRHAGKPIATVPALGIGTWRMGEDSRLASAEQKALELGIDLGAVVIDTAEMYGEGVAEEIVGRAIKSKREKLFIVSKVYPHNASEAGVKAACERSLKRLGTDRVDLYLLHWRGSHPLRSTIAGFESLVAQGKIRSWGVSNFDTDDMVELAAQPNGKHCASNQVLYHLDERGIEFDLLPALLPTHVAVMAYSPLGQGPLLKRQPLPQIAKKHGVTPAAIALAWVLRQPGTIAIPKATNLDHMRQNFRATDVSLDPDEIAALDHAFPPPFRKTPLATT